MFSYSKINSTYKGASVPLKAFSQKLHGCHSHYDTLFNESFHSDNDDEDLASYYAGLVSALDHFKWWLQAELPDKTMEALRKELKKEHKKILRDIDANLQTRGYNTIYARGYTEGISLLQKILFVPRQIKVLT
jgi:hypothetical protein